MAAKFGTSGLRGLAEELSNETVSAYVSAFVKHFVPEGTLVVGRDLRASSPRILRAVIECARGTGISVLDCGVLPTPALALECAKRGAPGVMVTGSHIPADRNGLKFYTMGGEFTKADEAVLLRAVRDGDQAAVVEGGAVAACDAAIAYVERYASFFGRLALSGMRVGVWEHSSAARDVLPDILNKIGASVIALGRTEDFIAVDTEAISGQVRAQLEAWAKEHQLDAIVSTDGDADRPLVTDETGNVVPGDILGPIVARELSAHHIVTTVSANTMVEEMDVFERVSRCRIGSPYVVEKMNDLMSSGARHVLGYEPNGGVLLGFKAAQGGRKIPPLMTRDAVLPIVAVLRAASGGAVSDLLMGLPKRRTATDRLTDVAQEVSSSIVAEVLAGASEILPVKLGSVLQVDLTDGARLTMENGMIVTIRPSGNAPELRCYVEAESGEAAASMLAELLARLAEKTRS
ncbi:MAG: phosphomannomutase [Boseongicola sp.]|nr:phosphomannomutase [Boseongicola sp.]